MCGPEGNHTQQGTESSHQQSQYDSTSRKPRTLVLCFDGTDNLFDNTNTNVVRLFAALEKNKPREQIVYYQPGIGTYVRPEASWAPSALREAGKAIDKGLAWYIGTHITGGYKFLMQHYSEGDRICLFGFSRGAFTARCLAGMLHKVGLLPRSNTEHVDFAYTLYKSTDKKSIIRAQEFKKTFSVHVEVEFVGVWDTVSSVGIREPDLPFNGSETFIRTFRHALAVDERRAKFQASCWQYSRGRTEEDGFTTIQELIQHNHPHCAAKGKNSLCDYEDDKNYHDGKLTDIFEVWFPGFHADVGGGNDDDNKRDTLANPSLRWMVTEILKTKPGIIFKKDAFENWLPSLAAKVQAFQDVSRPSSYLEVTSCHHGHASEATAVNGSVITPPLTPGSSYTKNHEGVTEANHDRVEEPSALAEAIAGPNDMLSEKPLWWILELLPLHNYWPSEGGKRVMGHRWNLGRHRTIYHRTPYFHKSIRIRIDELPNYADPRQRCRHPRKLQWVDEDDTLPDDIKELLTGRLHS